MSQNVSILWFETIFYQILRCYYMLLNVLRSFSSPMQRRTPPWSVFRVSTAHHIPATRQRFDRSNHMLNMWTMVWWWSDDGCALARARAARFGSIWLSQRFRASANYHQLPPATTPWGWFGFQSKMYSRRSSQISCVYTVLMSWNTWSYFVLHRFYVETSFSHIALVTSHKLSSKPAQAL